MRAVVCPELGGPEVLRLRDDWPRPQIGPGEVRIGVHAAGVNFADLLVLAGKYQEKHEPPFVLGTEGAGEILEVGEGVAGLAPGDRVLVQNNTVRGCYADEVKAVATRVARLPDGVPTAIAGGFPINYGTSYFAIVVRGQVKPGEVMVVHGASGGVGLAALQIGKALGATVIATGGDDAKLDILRGEGADHVVNYRTSAFHERVLELTGGRGADVYYDPVGGDVFDQSLKAIAPYGRVLVIGFTSGRIPSAPANRVLFKGISIVGCPYGGFSQRQPVEWAANMRALLGMVAAGTLKPRINRIYDLADAAQALQAVAGRAVVGKNVLVTERGRRAGI